ncbi:MAG: cell division protein ZapA [Alphaproteobacteria bacterium]|jgi:cell division protein ZapA|nr:cell division protein ZapA [Alphaproteobacteria bacterium]
MSVVSIPIVNRNYPMGCEDGQEGRLIELGRMVDARARKILDKMGPLQENSLLATLCIVLADEIQNKSQTPVATDEDLHEILARIREIKHKIS